MPSAGLRISYRPSVVANAGQRLDKVRASTAPPVAPRPHAPLSYTSTYLAAKILTTKTALEGERKQVTVLFADLKGSMQLLADRDPEEAQRFSTRP